MFPVRLVLAARVSCLGFGVVKVLGYNPILGLPSPIGIKKITIINNIILIYIPI